MDYSSGGGDFAGVLIGILILAGLVFCGLVALIAGIVALGRINRSDGKLRGRGLAVAAIVIGLLMLLGLPVVGVVGAGFLWFLAGEEDKPESVPPRVHRSYSGDAAPSKLPPQVKAELDRHIRTLPESDEVMIKADLGRKEPPAYDEDRKARIFANPGGQPERKPSR